MEPRKKPDAGGTRREQTHGKDTKYLIGNNLTPEQLAEEYHKSFEEFRKGFSKDTPTEFLFRVHDEYFTAKHVKTDKEGRLVWEI